MNQMRPIHPGEILREEFAEPLGLSINELAAALQIPAQFINGILKEQSNITPDIALRLARYFSTTPQFWMNLQTSYDLKIVMRNSGNRIEQKVLPCAA